MCVVSSIARIHIHIFDCDLVCQRANMYQLSFMARICRNCEISYNEVLFQTNYLRRTRFSVRDSGASCLFILRHVRWCVHCVSGVANWHVIDTFTEQGCEPCFMLSLTQLLAYRHLHHCHHCLLTVRSLCLLRLRPPCRRQTCMSSVFLSIFYSL